MQEILLSRRSLIAAGALATVGVSPSTEAQAKSHSFSIRSVDMMKVTQDTMHDPADQKHIDDALEKVVDLNATHVAIEITYDDGNGQFDPISQTATWIDAIKKHHLNTWHRHSHTAYEGFYDVKQQRLDFTDIIKKYIENNKDFFQKGDIFTPFPEPQNGGVQGMNGGNNGFYQYDSVASFNTALRSYVEVSKEAFHSFGFGESDIHVGYFGFDGFVVAALDNPDWEGKSFLQAETVNALGNVITVDHYPKQPGILDTDYKKMEQVFPKAKFVVGEFGPIGHADSNVSDEKLVAGYTKDLQGIRSDSRIIGLNAWLFVGGDDRESVILYDSKTDSFQPGIIYDVLKDAFR